MPPRPIRRIRSAMAKNDDDAADNLKQGLNLLWKAAKKTAHDVKKDVTVQTVTRAIEDAGREIARAAENVAGKVEEELRKIAPGDPDYVQEDDPRMKGPWDENKAAGEQPAKGSGESEKSSAPSKPQDAKAQGGLRIAIDDDPPGGGKSWPKG